MPADVRLLTAKDLFVSQAMLTGESIPLENHAIPMPSATGSTDARHNILEQETVCFMGSNVVSGAATAVVAATGDATQFSAMAKDIVGARPPTSFDIGVNRVSFMLIRFLLVMTPLVFFINGLTKGNWLEALLFALYRGRPNARNAADDCHDEPRQRLMKRIYIRRFGQWL